MTEEAHAPIPATTHRPIHRGAIAALVLSVVAVPTGWYLLALVAVILAHRTLMDVRRSQGAVRGEGLTIAALVLGYLGMVFWLLRYVLA